MNDEQCDKLARLIEKLLKEMRNMTATTDAAEWKKEWFIRVLWVMENQSREIDDLKSVVEKISINDDWQGWFGGGAKNFPCIQVFKHTDSFSKAFMIGFWGLVKSLLTVTIVGSLFTDVDRLLRRSYGFGNFVPSPFIRDILQNALLLLSDEQREVVIMKEYEGLKFREIAEALNMKL